MTYGWPLYSWKNPKPSCSAHLIVLWLSFVICYKPRYHTAMLRIIVGLALSHLCWHIDHRQASGPMSTADVLYGKLRSLPTPLVLSYPMTSVVPTPPSNATRPTAMVRAICLQPLYLQPVAPAPALQSLSLPFVPNQPISPPPPPRFDTRYPRPVPSPYYPHLCPILCSIPAPP